MKFRTYVLFWVLFGVVADTVIGLTLLKGAPWWALAAMAAPTAAAGLCLPFIGAGKHYANSLRVFSYLIFIFEFPKFLTALTGLILPAAWAVGIGAVVSAFFITFIFYVTRHLVVKETGLSFDNLPAAANGLRICHIADFHLGSFGTSSSYIRRIIDKVNELNPDLILFSGDLVNFESKEALSYKETLLKLKAKVYSILGNHDFLLHGPHDSNEASRKEDMARLEAFERELGWTVLRNESIQLPQGITLVGVDNITTNPYFRKVGGDLAKAMQGVPKDAFKILLSHDPTHWRNEVLPGTNIDLTLSGHTHGLKYKLTGLHPNHWRLHESAGLYEEGSRLLYVTAGLGSAFAFRLGGYPNIDIITLTKI
ncbi:MAG: metallophosphoesterase [Bacteroidales bacterium]|nr:metallophosphoesterase [Bacteroidales bacterium]